MNTEPLRSVAAIDSADGADRRCRLVPAPVLHHRQPDNNLRPVRKSCVFVRYEFFHCNNLRFVLWFYDSGDCSNRRCTKIPCREIFSAGDSCLYGPYALILNCFVISAVCIGLHPQCSCPIFFFSIFLNCVMGHSLYYSSVPFPLILWDDLQVPQERYTKNGVAGQQVSAGLYVANRHQYYANCKFSSWNLGFVHL